MARAMGGQVIHDADRAELGTRRLMLTDAGLNDPLLSPLGATFNAQTGHEDRVVTLPPGATLLASSDLVAAPDSGPVHMANAVGTAVLGLYATSNPKRSIMIMSFSECDQM